MVTTADSSRNRAARSTRRSSGLPAPFCLRARSRTLPWSKCTTGVGVSLPGFFCSIAVNCSRAKRRSPGCVLRNRRSLLPVIDSSSAIPRVGRRVAGGVVLNPNAEGTRFRAPAERRFLLTRAVAPNDLMTLLRTQLERDKFVRRAALLLQSSFSDQEITEAVARLAEEKKAFTSGMIVADNIWWEALRQTGDRRDRHGTRCVSGACRPRSGRTARPSIAR